MRTLSKQEIKDTIEGKGRAERVPVVLHLWNDPNAFSPEKREAVRCIQKKYGQDIEALYVNMPGTEGAFKWINYKELSTAGEQQGLDSNSYIADIESEIDLFVTHMPDPYYAHLFDGLKKPETDKYVLLYWWYGLFERQWWLRGMENALTDFYLYPEETHKLFRALTDFYKAIVVRAKKELDCDGIFFSDDIGTQNGPFFSHDIFREFFKPYYKEIVDTAHENGLHVWLHSCGNIELFIPDLIEIGVDVLHPIQKYAMDEQKIAGRFGDRICIWAGFDVQQIIPYGTPDEVLREVAHLYEVYDRPDGRFLLTAGNAITGDCPLESLEALYEACYAGSKDNIQRLLP